MTRKDSGGRPQAQRVTRQLLRRWPLRLPPADGDKEDRGHLLIIAGSTEVPGAAILAGTAALRVGVGKVSIATAAKVTGFIAQAVPEARVVPILETRGRLSLPAVRRHSFDAVLIGPGLAGSDSLSRLVANEVAARPQTLFVLDAGGIDAMKLSRLRRRLSVANAPRCIVTPHAGEMARLLDLDKSEVEARARTIAREFADSRNVVVAVKGAKTFLAEPKGNIWLHDSANIGLATSGSGDVLAGVIAGLAARGATAAQAAVWGVALHGMAGDRLAAKHGALGMLARELPHELPSLLDALRRRNKRA